MFCPEAEHSRMGTLEIPGMHVGLHSFSSGFEGDLGFQTTLFSFDLLMLFMLVWWSWVCTDLEVALASLDKIPHAAAAAAESCMARLGCDRGCPQCEECATFSASSKQHTGAWESCKAPQRSLAGSCVQVNTAPNQPLSTCSTISS